MQRDHNVDNLRGLAMIAMITIHATVLYWNDKVAHFFWDSLQWAVPVFLFCSAYLFFSRQFDFSFLSIKKYFVKRLTRLFIPYYVFLGVYTLLTYFFDRQKFNLSYFIGNFFVYKSLDLNWLVLIFFELMFVFPLVAFFKKKNKLIYYLFGLASLASSVYFLFFRPGQFKTIMWLPWSLIIYFTIYFIENQKKTKKMFLTALLSLIIFAACYFIEVKLGHPLTHFSNKYPPNLYHLSYGVFSIIILYLMSSLNLFKPIQKILNFFSINSYEIFFIHNLVIYLFVWMNIRFHNWMIFLMVIGGLTVILQILLNKIKKTTRYFLKSLKISLLRFSS